MEALGSWLPGNCCCCSYCRCRGCDANVFFSCFCLMARRQQGSVGVFLSCDFSALVQMARQQAPMTPDGSINQHRHNPTWKRPLPCQHRSQHTIPRNLPLTTRPTLLLDHPPLPPLFPRWDAAAICLTTRATRKKAISYTWDSTSVCSDNVDQTRWFGLDPETADLIWYNSSSGYINQWHRNMLENESKETAQDKEENPQQQRRALMLACSNSTKCRMNQTASLLEGDRVLEEEEEEEETFVD